MMKLNELLDEFSKKADEAYVENNFDEGEAISAIVELGSEASTIENYGDKVESYINNNITSFNSTTLEIWNNYLEKIYDAQED